jgi:hypothetical protein
MTRTRSRRWYQADLLLVDGDRPANNKLIEDPANALAQQVASSDHACTQTSGDPGEPALLQRPDAKVERNASGLMLHHGGVLRPLGRGGQVVVPAQEVLSAAAVARGRIFAFCGRAR